MSKRKLRRMIRDFYRALNASGMNKTGTEAKGSLYSAGLWHEVVTDLKAIGGVECSVQNMVLSTGEVYTIFAAKYRDEGDPTEPNRSHV